jgi:guanine nucleotide-binding protein G(i) subunit alpha
VPPAATTDRCSHTGNDEIEHQLKRDRVQARNEIKMLLLGAGESGKVRFLLTQVGSNSEADAHDAASQSTVLKQMKLIHHGGYNEQERESYKEIIFSNTVQSMRAILEALPTLEIQLNPANDARRIVIFSLPVQIEADTLPRDVADAIRGLWQDPSVQEAVHRAREFQLNDSAT